MPMEATGRELLHVEDLRVRFRTPEGDVHAVNGVSLQIEPGETVGLVGESGSGKSVTSLSLLGLLPRHSATVTASRASLGQEDLLRISEARLRELRGSEIGMIFQDPMTSLNPVLSIGEQLTETLHAHRTLGRAEARARAADLLRMVGISNPEQSLKRYPHQFSGGMRQRVMIAMALALEPRLLIADEPTTALDVTTQAQVLELLQTLTSERHTAVILITHDLGVVAGVTQKVLVMYAGSVVETATTFDLFANPRHPYTAGLLESVPRLDVGRGVAKPIEGTPPDLRALPQGCPFAPRCARQIDRCWAEMPPLEPVLQDPSSHRTACWNPVPH